MGKTEDDEDLFLAENSEKDTRNFSSLRVDNSFFNEEAYIVYDVVSVKRTKNSKKGESWDLMLNGKSVLKLPGTRFSNLEKEFLRTADGMKFLVSQYKAGHKSIVKIKENIKNL